MRFLIFAIAILFSSAPAFAQDTVFRNAIWGAGKEDIKKFESAYFYKEEGDSLLFMEQPDKFRRLITYDFRDGKLWRAKSEYRELHEANPQAILDLYGNTEIEFEKKLGAPTREEFIWKNRQYRGYPQFWGRSLRRGDLIVRAVWENGDTRTMLETYNDGMFYQLTHTAEQKSVADAGVKSPIIRMPGAPEKAP